MNGVRDLGTHFSQDVRQTQTVNPFSPAGCRKRCVLCCDILLRAARGMMR
jgi:hypothetical protein